MQRSVETLVEFVQGNTSSLNTRFLLDTKMLEILDRLIQKPSIPYVELGDFIDLQGAVSLLLLALLEGTSSRVEERMLSVLDVKRLADVAGSLHERSLDAANGTIRDRMTEVGFRLYMLVNHLLDYEDSERSGTLERSRVLSDAASEYYARYIARVEVSLRRRPRLHLRPRPRRRPCCPYLTISYFLPYRPITLIPSPPASTAFDSPFLSCSMRRAASSTPTSASPPSVFCSPRSRSSAFSGPSTAAHPAGRFRIFLKLLRCGLLSSLHGLPLTFSRHPLTFGCLSRAQDLHLEMRHQEGLTKSNFWRTLIEHRSIAVNAVFVLALVQNLILMIRYSPAEGAMAWELDGSISTAYALADDPLASTIPAPAAGVARGGVSWESFDLAAAEKITNVVLGVCQSFSCVVVFAIYAVSEGPLRVRQRFRESTGMSWTEFTEKAKGDWCLAIRYYALAPYYLLTAPTLVFYVCP